MVFPKHARPGERRNPSVYLILTGSVLIAFFLIALWVFSAPAAIPEQSGGIGVTNAQDDTKVSTESANNTPSDVLDTSTTEDELVTESSVDETVKNEDSDPVLGDGEREATTPDVTDADTGKKQEGEVNRPDEISSQAELTTENKEVNKTEFKTQVEESNEEKVIQTEPLEIAETVPTDSAPTVNDDKVQSGSIQQWKLCSFEGAQDYIPCLDNKEAIKKLKSRSHYQHRERHCPSEEDIPKCLLPLPKGYKVPIKWPMSRDQIWFNNVPYTQLVSYKADQNWVKVSDNNEKLIFPGGGTQFKEGALHYIDFIEQAVPDIAWGKHTRVLLDVGCGVASFGGYLFNKDVLAMSIAPKDEHEAQVQMALERGIPAVSTVMGTQRLVFPSNVFDVVHCARCRVPWHIDGGMLLLELNRVLRPGGFFVWSATPVYWKDDENKQIWRDTKVLMDKMSWTLIAKKNDHDSKVGAAIFQKPKDNNLYDLRKEEMPPFCNPDDKPDAAWYVEMKACIHKLPAGEGERGTSWPTDWPLRVNSTPSWLSTTEKGIYGKPVAEDYRSDTDHWKRVFEKSYLQGLGIDWSSIRNVMDMKAGYGGFAAAMVTQKVWVMNIVPVTEPDTLPIIFDRGLIGMYHDWCEPHSTYPRSYDLMHSDHLLSTLTKCNIGNVVMEMDRILRPDGWAIFRDTVEVLSKVKNSAESLHWDIVLVYAQGNEELLVTRKRFWRPVST